MHYKKIILCNKSNSEGELQTFSIDFTHDCLLVLYMQLMQTGSVLLLLQLPSVLNFPLYEDTADGRAVTHQLYSFAIDVWWGANAADHTSAQRGTCELGRLLSCEQEIWLSCEEVTLL